MHQRMIRKKRDDDHYCAAILKYTSEFAVEFKDYCSYICTDDKHKIDIGEPNMPLSELPIGKRVLVGRNETYQVSDHDFSNISLIRTVMLITQIPEKVDDSWYKGVPCVTLTLAATSPSTSIRNAASRPCNVYRRWTGTPLNFF